MKIFGYCRVSTTEQANSGLSLDTQRQQITGYAMMKGWAVAEFFIESGVSGSVPLSDRPEGQRMLAALQPGDVIITAKLDRAFRSAADALGTLEQLKEDKVALHMIDLGGDVTGNGISKLVFTILSAVAENERDRIRERVRDAKRHRASQRLFNGGKRPFGFDIEGDGKSRHLVPNANEQAALTRGLVMHADGVSLRGIALVWSTEYGLDTFDAKTVQRILSRQDLDQNLISPNGAKVMPEVLYSMMPLPEIFRVSRHDPDAKNGETELKTLGEVARYLQNDFDSSHANDLMWKLTAAAVEAADRDAKNMPHAVRALEALLNQENRIILPYPGVVGQFVQSGG